VNEDHILNHSSNPHLHNAIVKYGLSLYAFVILEYCITSDLLKREQHFLDLLFSLAKELRYNLSSIAGAPIAGRTHTPETLAQMSISQQLVDRSGENNPIAGRTHSEETRAQMSDSQQLVDRSGENNPMHGKVPTNAFQSGPHHPMYGKVPTNAMTVNVYSIDNVLVGSFPSKVACAQMASGFKYNVSLYSFR